MINTESKLRIKMKIRSPLMDDGLIIILKATVCNF